MHPLFPASCCLLSQGGVSCLKWQLLNGLSFTLSREKGKGKEAWTRTPLLPVSGCLQPHLALWLAQYIFTRKHTHALDTEGLHHCTVAVKDADTKHFAQFEMHITQRNPFTQPRMSTEITKNHFFLHHSILQWWPVLQFKKKKKCRSSCNVFSLLAQPYSDFTSTAPARKMPASWSLTWKCAHTCMSSSNRWNAHVFISMYIKLWWLKY